ncbi:MAG TPA: hypothetical protein VNM38_10295, partial [Solirubrobacterales bacterium]|nr:hypothetical protein [Solirubrobacterales bacterium]
RRHGRVRGVHQDDAGAPLGRDHRPRAAQEVQLRRRDQLGEDANSELYGGWPMILSGLKTLLETGEGLDTPGSLRYANP